MLLKLRLLLLSISLILISDFSYSQNFIKDINTSLGDEFEAIFQNVDKNRIPYGLLKDAALEFTELKEYNGVLRDTNYVHPGVLKQIYKTLLFSRMRTNVTTGFIDYDDFVGNWRQPHFAKTDTPIS